MSENKKPNMDANSREFTRGVEAGLNSEDTKYWQAGYELGHELNEETTEATKGQPEREPDDPLFLADTLDGQKGDPQDDQNKSAE